MNSDKHVHDFLSAYLDEMCSVEEKECVERHLVHCPECRKDLEELKTAVRLVRELNRVEAPQEIIAQVEERLRKRSSFAWWRLQPVPSLVVVMVIFLLAVTVNRYSSIYKYRQKLSGDTVPGTFDKENSSPKIKLPKSTRSTWSKQEVSELRQSPAPAGAVANSAGIGKEKRFSAAKSSSLSHTVVSKGRGKKGWSKDGPQSPVPYLVEMEVTSMDEGLRELKNLAESYQAEHKQVFEEENDVFLEIQERNFTDFVNELQHIGKVSYGFAPEEKLDESTATTHSSDSRVIRIKFNQNR